MNTKQIFCKPIFLLIVLLFLSGCVTKDKQPTLLETNCALPCWNGIVPGETSKDDVLKILPTLDNVNQKSILEETFGGVYGEMVRFDISSDSFLLLPSVEIRFREDRVASIFFFGDLKLTFGKLIELTGEPNWVDRWQDYGGKTFMTINIAKGIVFGSYDSEDVTPETQVTFIGLFSPDEFQTLADNKQMLPHFSFDSMMKSIVPWQGYGNLDEKYPMKSP